MRVNGMFKAAMGSALLVLGLVSSAAKADTIIKYPTADAYVSYADPTKNFGTDYGLEVNVTGTGDPVSRSLLAFDLTGVIPPGAALVSATLWLDPSGMGTNLGHESVEIGAFKVTEPWNENEVAWNNQPAFDSTCISSQSIRISDFSLSSSKFIISWDVTAAWPVTGNLLSIGLAPLNDSGSASFGSRENFGDIQFPGSSTWVHLDFRPYLEIVTTSGQAVPLPSTAWMGGIMMTGLGLIRVMRRRA